MLFNSKWELLCQKRRKQRYGHEMGLDQPFIIQYFQWVGKIFNGNMGYSYIKNQEVFPMFMQALPNTLLLTLSSIVTTILISIPLGIWSAGKTK